MGYKDKTAQIKYQCDWLRRRKLEAVKYKGGKCSKCGYGEHYAALQFHHTDPSTKTAKWTGFRNRSWSEVKKELDLCEIVCANCHLIIHSVSKYD